MPKNKPEKAEMLFREKDLLPVDGFIFYVRKRGINIDRKQLEDYERERLLFPAVRVFFPKDGSPISVSKDWLKKYHVEYPADRSFRAWKDHKSTSRTFYSYLQIFTFRLIQTERSAISESDDYLRSKIDEYNRVLYIASDINFLWNEMFLWAETKAAEDFKEYKEKESDSVFRDRLRLWERNNLKLATKKIFKKHKCTNQQVEHWAHWIARLGFSVDPVVDWKGWLDENLPQHLRERAKGDLLFAYDCYALAERLMWALGGIKGMSAAVEEFYKLRDLSPDRKRKFCLICSKPFTPKSSGRAQVTCSISCSKEHKKRMIYRKRPSKKSLAL